MRQPTDQTPSVAVRDYDPVWQLAFDALESELRRAAGDVIVAIDHIGSTAVPGMAARPIIDGLIRIIDLQQAETLVDPAMAGIGFTHSGKRSDGRRFYVRPATLKRPTCHIHVVPLWHRAAGDHLRLRDYLRAAPSQARRYSLLKRQLAACYPDDCATYISGKSDLMHRLLGQARRYY